MQVSRIIILFLLASFTNLFAQQQTFFPKSLNFNKPLNTIAFGSCNNQAKPQKMWSPILKNKPDLWIWLGDNIYADTDKMPTMAKKYQKQKSNPAYNHFLSHCPVVGTWDDHDYGKNDGCRTFKARKGSKEQLLNFLDVPRYHEAWFREGIYQHYNFGPKGKRVCVILLDARYFRDPLKKAPKDSTQRYIPSTTGTVLGEEQWQWLEKILSESEADIHIIASGIQILSDQHAFEKWANFPKERQRLLSLLEKVCPKKPILLSGDRHIAEVSAIKLTAYEQPIHEITASGLTHSWKTPRKEANPYRVGDLIIQRNFALLKIDWTTKQCTVEIRGLENKLYQEIRF